MKMTNAEAIDALNGLAEIQEKERAFYEEKKERLLKGRIEIVYAAAKNAETLKNSVNACNKVLVELDNEYRDVEAEQKALMEEREKAVLEARKPRKINMIPREGKDFQEYLKKRRELMEIENGIPIHTVSLESFEGLELDSSEMQHFIFMIE